MFDVRSVGVDDSLVVPGVLDVQNMSLDQLAALTSQIVKDARDGKVAGMGRGVFTISNLGMFDVDNFVAIILPPQAAMMAVGSVRPRPVVKDNEIVIECNNIQDNYKNNISNIFEKLENLNI